MLLAPVPFIGASLHHINSQVLVPELAFIRLLLITSSVHCSICSFWVTFIHIWDEFSWHKAWSAISTVVHNCSKAEPLLPLMVWSGQAWISSLEHETVTLNGATRCKIDACHRAEGWQFLLCKTHLRLNMWARSVSLFCQRFCGSGTWEIADGGSLKWCLVFCCRLCPLQPQLTVRVRAGTDWNWRA